MKFFNHQNKEINNAEFLQIDADLIQLIEYLVLV